MLIGYTDVEYVNGFMNSDNKVISHFKKKYQKKFANFIKHKYLNTPDVDIDDIFQESLDSLWENIRNGKYVHKNSLETYFFSIGLNNRRKKYRISQKVDCSMYEENEGWENWEEQADDFESKELCLQVINEVLDTFFQVSSPCLQIIRNYFFEGLKGQASAKLLGFLNTDVLKTEKYKCMKRLEIKIREEIKLRDPSNVYIVS